MFGKLMKYEMKAYLRVFLPLWGGMILLAVINGLNFSGSLDELFDVALAARYIIPLIIYGMCLVASAVMSTILIITRFWKGLLGREGYLMFTLPVSKDMLVLSKLCGAFAVTILSTAAAGVSAVLAVLTMGGKEVLEALPQFLNEFIDLADLGLSGAQLMKLLAAGLICILMAEVASILKFYAAMCAGQLVGKYRMLCSVGVYVCIGIVWQRLGDIFAFIFGSDFFSSSITNLIGELSYSDYESAMIILITTAISYGVCSAVYWLLCHFILKNRLNLE